MLRTHGALVLVLLVVGAVPGLAARCDPSGADAAAVAAARVAVEGACDCDLAGQTHGQYVRCARQAIEASGLRQECWGTVRRCYSRSTCGKPGFVACCRTKATGASRCTIRRDASRCTAPVGGTACVSTLPSCCDACGPSGCGVATTTTTSTSTTTVTTLPPLPDDGCTGGSGAPTCDGTCDAGFQCLAYSRLEGPACGCFPVGAAPCDTSLFPQCADGACPGGYACGGVEAFDPTTNNFLVGCGCVDPGRACSSDANGMCADVGYCPPPEVCIYTPIAPHTSCPCCGCGAPF